VKSTTKDSSFEQAPIKALSVKGHIYLPTQNDFPELDTIIMVLLVQLYKTSSSTTLIPCLNMLKVGA